MMTSDAGTDAEDAPSTLLIIDDSETDRQCIRAALAGEAVFSRILEAGDGIEGLAMLIREPVDVVLCDLEMPRLGGDKILRMREARQDRRHVPFLFMTASGSTQRRTQLLSDGASDAIAKPFHMPELVARLRLHLKLKRVQEELCRKNAALEELATVDPLTGLRTRRFLDEQLALEFERSARHGTPLSVVLADIDHFKQVNDRYGHPAGDAVLRGVGELTGRLARRTDVAGRYGGEELLFIQTHNSISGAMIWAERVRAQVEAARFETPSGAPSITLSLGVAEYRAEMVSCADLVAAADRALYAAKRQGRNRVVVDAITPTPEAGVSGESAPAPDPRRAERLS
jgi:two-component system, cell cycle response regulator